MLVCDNTRTSGFDCMRLSCWHGLAIVLVHMYVGGLWNNDDDEYASWKAIVEICVKHRWEKGNPPSLSVAFKLMCVVGVVHEHKSKMG